MQYYASMVYGMVMSICLSVTLVKCGNLIQRIAKPVDT